MRPRERRLDRGVVEPLAPLVVDVGGAQERVEAALEVFGLGAGARGGREELGGHHVVNGASVLSGMGHRALHGKLGHHATTERE
jgi:hypothetical protein